MAGKAVHLYYFSHDEFRSWASDMSPRLLVLLDLFRHRWGQPVMVSPHQDALGRRGMGDSLSDHNYDRWGEVRGIDVMPLRMSTPEAMQRAVKLATGLGFTSIGLYPHWRPRPGLHLGVRHSNRPGFPATWGAVRKDGRQTYVSLAEALEQA